MDWPQGVPLPDQDAVSPGLRGEDPEGGAGLGQLLPLHGIGPLLWRTTSRSRHVVSKGRVSRDTSGLLNF